MGCCSSSSNLEIKKSEKGADEPILKTPNLSLDAQDDDFQNETPLLGTSGQMSFKNVDDGINTKELDKMLEDEEEEIDSYEENHEDVDAKND